MTYPNQPIPGSALHVDKVKMTAHYDEKTNRCALIDIVLNYDGISREDLTAAIASLFHPDAMLHTTTTTFRHTELGSTDVIQRPEVGQVGQIGGARPMPSGQLRLNGVTVNPQYQPVNPPPKRGR